MNGVGPCLPASETFPVSFEETWNCCEVQLASAASSRMDERGGTFTPGPNPALRDRLTGISEEATSQRARTCGVVMGSNRGGTRNPGARAAAACRFRPLTEANDRVQLIERARERPGLLR